MKTMQIQLVAMLLLILMGTSCSKEQLIDDGSARSINSIAPSEKARAKLKVRMKNSLLDAKFRVGSEEFIGDLDLKEIACNRHFEHLECDFGDGRIESVQELSNGNIQMNLSGSQAVKTVTFSKFRKTENGTRFEMTMNTVSEPFQLRFSGSEAPSGKQLRAVLLNMAGSGGHGDPDIGGGQICGPCVTWAIRGIIILGGIAIAECQAIVEAARANCATPPCTFVAGFCSGTCSCPTP